MTSFLRAISEHAFRLGQRLGLNVVPNHYYVPLADIAELSRTRNSWARSSLMPGIDTNIDAQVDAIREIVLPFQAEYDDNRNFIEGVNGRYGLGYGPIEAQALHGVLRWLKPSRIIEIGSGVSTHCMFKATADYKVEIICIEPYPRPFLRTANVQLQQMKVEHLDPVFFDRLNPGDFLFIDSSHAVRPGGDVVFIYTEILPRLKAGIIVHVHDIYFPYTFNRDVLQTYMQWSESAMLQALLVNNKSLNIIFSLSMLHYCKKEVLEQIFPLYRPQHQIGGLVVGDRKNRHFPSAIFLKTV